MEMMSLGIPVVSYGGEYTPYIARIWDLESIAEQVEKCWNDLEAPGSTLREDTIKYAQEHFNREIEVQKSIDIYNIVTTE